MSLEESRLAGRSVLVVGAGIGGLAAALTLARRGADVTVLEQAAEITEVGAGLQITPNGLAVLRALGLEGALAERSVGAQAVVLRDYRRGRELFRLDLAARAGQGDTGYRFVHRADLIVLLARAVREAGVRLRLLQQVMQVEPGPRPAVVTGQGARFDADLVIGADGIRSRLRPVLNGVTAPFFTGQVAWRAIVPNLTGHPPEARVHLGPGRHLVSYPVRDGHIVNLVGVEERRRWTEEGWHHADAPDNFRAAFARFDAEVHHLLAGLDTVHLWGLFRHPVARVWQQGNCALLGDAAHPTLPFLAQGANLALEDAWVLAECLADAADPAAGFARYGEIRRPRAERVVEAASRNAWKFHLSAPPLRFAAHAGLRIASRLLPGHMRGQFDWLHGHDVTARGSSGP